MKLIKLNEEHYVIVDDSEIKEGDFVVALDTNVAFQATARDVEKPIIQFKQHYKKITHSTRSLKGVKNISVSEVFVFTPEQLNEYTQTVIKQALETASEKAYHIAKYESTHPLGGSRIAEVWVSKQSITDTFEETFKKFEV